MSNSESQKAARYTLTDFRFWRITSGLALGSFFIFAGLYSVQPLLPIFADEFHLAPAQSGLILSVTVLSLAFGLVILGFYSDRVGRVRIIQFSLLGTILPFVLIPLSHSFGLLLILRFLQGFAMAGLPACAGAYIAEEIKSEYVGFAMSLYIASNAVGGMVGRLLAGYAAEAYSWTFSFYFFAAAGLILFLINLFLLPKSRFFVPSNVSFSGDVKQFGLHFRNRELLPAFFWGMVLQIAFTGVWTYIPFYLQSPYFSLSIRNLSNFYIAYVFGIVGAPLGGYLAGKLGQKRILAAGVLILLIGIWLSATHSLVFIGMALSLLCLGFFIAHSMAAAFVSQQARDHKGSASGLYLVFYYFGVAIGGSVLGLVWTQYGWTGIVWAASLSPVCFGLFWMKRQMS
ncbi:MAG TPA: MFS transporter [Bacillales bacterium]|nr:MFS transporter [Bacillales bacterium]